jgi:hypothetical protein
MDPVHGTDLETLVRTPPPRDWRALDSLSERHLKQLTKPWLGSAVLLAVFVPLPLIAAATTDSLDTFSWVFLSIFEIAAIVIVIAVHFGERRKGRSIEHLLAQGEAHAATIMEMVHLMKGNPSRPSRLFRVRAEATTPAGIASMAVKVPVAVANRMEVGMIALVVVHDGIPFSLWVFPAGFTPALGSLPSV